MHESFFFIAFSTLFTIVNPIGALGPFLAMTATDEQEKRKSIAFRASLISCVVLIFCTGAGAFIFRFFGFSLAALKIAGGILLFLIAIDMLNAKQSRSRATIEETEEGVLKNDVAVFPLGIPLLTGPGAIASVFMLADKAQSKLDFAAIYLAIVLTSAVTFGLLRQAHFISRLFGKIGVNVISRLMGLALAAIAAQFVIDGLHTALPGMR